MIDDKRLSFGHKAPRKPLALLKLLALHPRGISSDATLAALWPDLEGDAAADALAAALHRLRKLLGDAEAVMLSEGRLFLDPRRIWVDALAFEALSEAGVHEHQRQALDVYRGRLLPYDDGEGWTIAARERLSGRYLQLVRRLGERDEAEGRLEDAVALYRGAIELEPLGEPLYQGLMRCMRKLGRESEGLAVYRQLQDVLRREIAASPSAQSRELAQRLRGVE